MQQNHLQLEASFSTLVMSIFSSAMVELGEVANPQSGNKAKNLQAAQFNIELLITLREKTKGNLTAEETNLLAHMINELQMKYLSANAKEDRPSKTT